MQGRNHGRVVELDATPLAATAAGSGSDVGALGKRCHVSAIASLSPDVFPCTDLPVT